ncbi:MAG: hypothetical protein P8X74_20645, partial [Reinekea sp.]
NQDASGTEFFNAKGHQLVEVQRDHEVLPVTWQLVSDDKTVLVSLGREPAYNATVFVEVNYDGESFARYQYQTQPLPTLINLSVVDQYDRPVPRIVITLGDRRTVTDDKGFAQLGVSSDQAPLATGAYLLSVNPDRINPAYGETRLTIDINGGELNDYTQIPLSFLNPEIGAGYLESGKNHVLNGGDVRLDLTNAKVVFPDGRTEGSMHLQFNTRGFNYPTHPLVQPGWLYSFQPLGIQLQGHPAIQLEMPTHNNSRSYLPEDGTLALVLAVNPANELIEPVTIAELHTPYMTVLYPDNIQVLDQLGIAFLPIEFQPLLAQYRDGDIGFDTLMINMSELARSIEPTLKEK